MQRIEKKVKIAQLQTGVFMTLRYLTAGESHGPALTGIVEGMPAGVKLCRQDFDILLRRRRAGYGRGARVKIEADRVEVLAGVVGGLTIGSPIALLIRNDDFATHSAYMDPFEASSDAGRLKVPLPGHADLPGIQKYGFNDCRPIRERASARETAMRTALSVPPRKMLQLLNVGSTCFVESIGGIQAAVDYEADPAAIALAVVENGDEFLTPDAGVIDKWRELIDTASENRFSLGGSGAVIFSGLPVGLGSHVHFDRRLDSILAGLVMSIPAVRGVEIGCAVKAAASRSACGDAIFYSRQGGFTRGSNLAAGLEGGMTNGQPLIIRFHMKPLPGNSGLESVNLDTLAAEQPPHYRSDIQAVAAAAVAVESVVAIQLASEILAATGGNNIDEVAARLHR